MARPDIYQFTCLQDNFGVLIHDTETGRTLAIDAPEEAPIRAALAEKGWTLSDILITHHHWDHVQAAETLRDTFQCRIIGPAEEADKIGHLDQTVREGDQVAIGSLTFEVIAVPGHTLGHIAYHCPEHAFACVGDSLFALGCGRIFEGTPPMMWESLAKLASLPANTAIYCGHEYTLANAMFALTIEPKNVALVNRVADIKALRDAGKPTLPTSIGVELATNPFLRAFTPEVKAALAMEDASPAEVFAEIRQRKDNA